VQASTTELGKLFQIFTKRGEKNAFVSHNENASERFPHIALFGRTQGSRTRGRPGKKWLDIVKEDCAAMNLALVEATRVAEDRRFWKTSIRHLGGQRARTPSSSQTH